MHLKKYKYFGNKFFRELYIESIGILEYNNIRNKVCKFPGVYDNPTFLNLHLLLWDSYISEKDVRPPFAVEDRRFSCGYPPSGARSQKVGNGTLGLIKNRTVHYVCSIFLPFCSKYIVKWRKFGV